MSDDELFHGSKVKVGKGISLGWIQLVDQWPEGALFIQYDQHGVEVDRWRVGPAVKVETTSD